MGSQKSGAALIIYELDLMRPAETAARERQAGSGDLNLAEFHEMKSPYFCSTRLNQLLDL